ncbi:UDP-N-acetylmuramoyl-L-alanyl-D-glutamate--2,6-diaminopimelate ligase [Patescibacteria group bacterium]|nr:UDP-N-acetylmuramoyl-L-alanyl-D-glutamate--2,6-diaminopimelate ligase [Patescibacteria group bacterium]MBU4057695.1 UDP-N-acetylmuramoyl-L-alanyl-D-glutamate--2,6-diaminopimelate ligase [Patescibacteria group bacterium]MBU4115648.1 UDP-N-acetylmuramoyl-L-alanyl-D-glutamate--2,6-diaminopimelate ligase [Patescibacteria group bacterium]
MLDNILYKIKKFLPISLFRMFQPVYHYILSFFAVLIYRFPSNKITVVGVTGTKGKTSTVEIISAILEEAGLKTALMGTLRFKIGNETEKNNYKMTMPGRFFIQRFLRRAVNAGCNYVILEVTSQGIAQYRHKFINFDALIFTNLSPEHIEYHGSYEKYLEVKLKAARALEKSKKKRKIIISNTDDKEGYKFLNIDVTEKYPYSIRDAEPFIIKKDGLEITIDDVKIEPKLSGQFNLYNIVAAIKFVKTQGVNVNIIKYALEKFSGIRGRLEKIEEGQDFTVIVDYAHTPDSLEKVYEVFQSSKKICVLGNTGGGRDKWKRKEMAKIAKRHCTQIILTNEDPYDENPLEIVGEMKKEIGDSNCQIIIDRREAIKKALELATTGDAVLITGKGTDPYIMGPNNTKVPWDDATVVREEIKKIQNANLKV